MAPPTTILTSHWIFDPSDAIAGYDHITMIGSTTVLCPAAIAATQTPGDVLAGNSNDARGAAVMIALMGLCTLVYAVRRANAVRRTFVTIRRKVDAELELLHVVARRQLWRALGFAAGCVLAGLAITRLPIDVDTRLILGVTPGLMLLVALVSVRGLLRLLHVQADPDLHVVSHGDFLYAARGDRLVGWVAAPPKLIARASGLPVARVARSA